MRQLRIMQRMEHRQLLYLPMRPKCCMRFMLSFMRRWWGNLPAMQLPNPPSMPFNTTSMHTELELRRLERMHRGWDFLQGMR